MNKQEESGQKLCLRGLRRYQLGEDFDMWMLNVYQEMVANKLHSYVPYDTESKSITTLASETLDKIIKDRTENEKTQEEATELEEIMINSYSIRCTAPEKVLSLEEIEKSSEVVNLSTKIPLERCSSR